MKIVEFLDKHAVRIIGYILGFLAGVCLYYWFVLKVNPFTGVPI